VALTIAQAHSLLQGLFIRRGGGRLPHHVYMAMCYLQVEITGPKSQAVDDVWPGGANAKTV
jgi:hypothetical protein